jgi:hypothetical protein
VWREIRGWRSRRSAGVRWPAPRENGSARFRGAAGWGSSRKIALAARAATPVATTIWRAVRALARGPASTSVAVVPSAVADRARSTSAAAAKPRYTSAMGPSHRSWDTDAAVAMSASEDPSEKARSRLWGRSRPCSTCTERKTSANGKRMASKVPTARRSPKKRPSAATAPRAITILSAQLSRCRLCHDTRYAQHRAATAPTVMAPLIAPVAPSATVPVATAPSVARRRERDSSGTTVRLARRTASITARGMPAGPPRAEA